jgi:hypothetical protein
MKKLILIPLAIILIIQLFDNGNDYLLYQVVLLILMIPLAIYLKIFKNK